MRRWIDLISESLDPSQIEQWEAELESWEPPTDLDRPRPEDIEMFRKVREVVRYYEGGGGMCHRVSEWIDHVYGWPQESGVVVSRDGEVQVDAHYWNELPDGSILDCTADQLGEGKDIEIVSPDDPEYGRYAEEWYGDWHPGGSEWQENSARLGYRKPEHWTGEVDHDLAQRLTRERGPNWGVTHPDQLRAYLEQQLVYAKREGGDLVHMDGHIKWLQDKLDDLNARHPITEAFGTTEKLYHGTNIDNLWLIMRDGKLTSNAHGRDYAGPTGVCLSRSFRVAADHAGSWADNLYSSFFEYFGLECREGFSGTAVFEFDRARIKEKLIPFNDFGGGQGDDSGDEQEERVVGDLSLDALTGIYVRKGELEEFLELAVKAHKEGGLEYDEQFRAIIQNVLKDPRLQLY